MNLSGKVSILVFSQFWFTNKAEHKSLAVSLLQINFMVVPKSSYIIMEDYLKDHFTIAIGIRLWAVTYKGMYENLSANKKCICIGRHSYLQNFQGSVICDTAGTEIQNEK